MPRLTVKFKKDTPGEHIREVRQRNHGVQKRRFDEVGWRVIEVDDVDTALKDYADDESVEFVEVDQPGSFETFPTTPPDDPLYAGQWHLDRIGAPTAWTVQPGGSADVVVAVIDTGVDYTADPQRTVPNHAQHPDLPNVLVLPGSNILAVLDPEMEGEMEGVPLGVDWPLDRSVIAGMVPYVSDRPETAHLEGEYCISLWHGTSCAGTIGGAINNNALGCGVAGGITIMPVKVGTGDGGGLTASIASAAVLFAVDNGAKVINGSWTFPGYPQMLRDAFKYARDRGVLVILAAGNASQWTGDAVRSSSLWPETFAVSAMNSLHELHSQSCRGWGVGISAPGFPIATMQGWGLNEYENGPWWRTNFGLTSAAAPVVSGAAALIWSHDPTLTADEVMAKLAMTTHPKVYADDAPGYNVNEGWGQINLGAAIQVAKGDIVRRPRRPRYTKQVSGNNIVYSWDGVDGASFYECVGRDPLGTYPSVPVHVSRATTTSRSVADHLEVEIWVHGVGGRAEAVEDTHELRLAYYPKGCVELLFPTFTGSIERRRPGGTWTTLAAVSNETEHEDWTTDGGDYEYRVGTFAGTVNTGEGGGEALPTILTATPTPGGIVLDFPGTATRIERRVKP